MDKTIPAIYHDGVLQPLEDLPLTESEQVVITVVSADDASELFALEAWNNAAVDPITWREVQQGLARVTGSWSQNAIDQREDR